MNTVSVPSSGQLYITQGDRQRRGEGKHSWVFTRYTPELRSVTCVALHHGREPPASAVIHYRVKACPALFHLCIKQQLSQASGQISLSGHGNSPGLGRWEGNKVLWYLEPGLHIFLNQPRLARGSTAIFYGCYPGLFTLLCCHSATTMVWGLCFFPLSFVCVLNLFCSKKIHFSWPQ